MKKLLKVLFLMTFLASCAATPVVLERGAQNVKTGKNDPPEGSVEIGSISVQDGSGCGLYGFRGEYERAVILLRNKAMQMGGNYVQIYSMTEPHSDYNCFVNSFVIRGTVYESSGQKRNLSSK